MKEFTIENYGVSCTNCGKIFLPKSKSQYTEYRRTKPKCRPYCCDECRRAHLKMRSPEESKLHKEERQKKYREQHREEIIEWQKEYYITNKESELQKKSQYRQKKRAERIEKLGMTVEQYDEIKRKEKEERQKQAAAKKIRDEQRKIRREAIQESRKNSIDSYIKKQKKTYSNEQNIKPNTKPKKDQSEFHKLILEKYGYQTISELREKDKAAYNREYQKYYYSTDPLFKLKHNLRRIIRARLTEVNARKYGPTFEMLGYDAEDLYNHIEKQFKEDMTWENHGEIWEIDHIVPISLARSQEEVILLNQIENLQPLYTAENREKLDNFIGNYEE